MITPERTPILIISLLQYTDLGQWFHINPFKDSFTFWVLWCKHYLLHKKWSFPLRISSVNVTKSAASSRFNHIYWRNPYSKTSFFVQCTFREESYCSISLLQTLLPPDNFLPSAMYEGDNLNVFLMCPTHTNLFIIKVSL